MIKAGEISEIIKRQLAGYEADVSLEEVGRVIEVGDGIARIYGLEQAMAGELLQFPNDVVGMVLNLEEEQVGAVLLGDDKLIKEGDQVKRTNRIAQVPVGDAVIGLASSGVHSNGYSLVRKVVFDLAGLGVDDFVPELGQTVGEALLTPTRIYVRPVRHLLEGVPVKAMAHITGGGLVGNLPRVLPAGCRAVLDASDRDIRHERAEGELWPSLELRVIEQTGAPLDPAPFRIGRAVYDDRTPDINNGDVPPAVTWTGRYYLVAFTGTASQLRLARVTAGGVVLDGGGILVATPRRFGQTRPSFAGGVESTFLVWQEGTPFFQCVILCAPPSPGSAANWPGTRPSSPTAGSRRTSWRRWTRWRSSGGPASRLTRARRCAPASRARAGRCGPWPSRAGASPTRGRGGRGRAASSGDSGSRRAGTRRRPWGRRCPR